MKLQLVSLATQTKKTHRYTTSWHFSGVKGNSWSVKLITSSSWFRKPKVNAFKLKKLKLKLKLGGASYNLLYPLLNWSFLSKAYFLPFTVPCVFTETWCHRTGDRAFKQGEKLHAFIYTFSNPLYADSRVLRLWKPMELSAYWLQNNQPLSEVRTKLKHFMFLQKPLCRVCFGWCVYLTF